MKRLQVLTTPNEVVPERLSGSTAVVIDVLLATTTLVTILENGARRLFPVGALPDAARLCGRLEAETLVRGGEQNALPIDGYDCGPFPDEYHPDRVRGRDVVFVSTNGTRTIARSSAASHLVVASLRNAPAVARYLARADHDSVYLICAGSAGRFALEDFACAAVLVREIGAQGWRFDDAARLALELGQRYHGREADLLTSSRAGTWFLENGREQTFAFASEVGASEVVAVLRGEELVRVHP